ncbi:putative cinnamyl-alcohol dehydrogenase [Helianthus annuus]|nr:putative cinnamyl-alcohol dehydrogenase [Helianthus annuus]KAJ0444564.1 putative cinnamyl-alcohol dehydrogenase [Helianthus annuus]KAJ0461844.1 putative cinnamyl-alcohol dehydrogenase [Helianthus annuus]KAJ0642231.1 putative cinnamyl-alcohol dehydrogenase [Helianthus annuus]KAJ0646116.1 putative cinnamyl-alcohol dehydrogenase [Helianthus annuus]
MSAEGKVVCVTGASGYIASWLVKLLLDRGYTVHATVRSLGHSLPLCYFIFQFGSILLNIVKHVADDPKETQHLLALDGAKERLSLFEANLTTEGSFDSAVSGCICVFHTASPVTFASVDDPQMELLDPAVKGTLNVLKSAAKVQSLKRVVLTSSLAAVLFCDKLRCGVVDETWFSDPAICEQRKVYVSFGRVAEVFVFWGEDQSFNSGYGVD